MPSKTEAARRKAIVRELALKERAEAEARMPIPKDQLGALFDFLDETLASGCDHTLSLTQGFLRARGLSEESIIPWLRSYGGYCDCEVLGNVGDKWDRKS